MVRSAGYVTHFNSALYHILTPVYVTTPRTPIGTPTLPHHPRMDLGPRGKSGGRTESYFEVEESTEGRREGRGRLGH